jgi:hypothetical protein
MNSSSSIYPVTLYFSTTTLANTTNATTSVKETFVWFDLQMLASFLYVSPILGVIGLFLNILVFIVLSDAQFKETLYKYLKVEAIFIGSNLFLQTLRPIHYNRMNWLSKSYFSHFYLVYGLHWFASILEMAAVISQLCSTLDFYLLISNYHKKFKIFTVLEYYKIVGSAIFISSVLLYLYKIFDTTIACYLVAYETHMSTMYSNENSTILSNIALRHLCRDEKTEFDKTIVKKVFEMGVFILRDFVLLLCLMALNVLIYFRVKQSMANKKSVLKYMLKNREKEESTIQSEQITKGVNLVQKKQSKNIEKTRQKATLMVIFNGLNYFFGRTPILIFFIWNNTFEWSDSLLLCLQIAVLAVYLSYTIKFFLYYYSNNKFRKTFKKKAFELLYFFHKSK